MGNCGGTESAGYQSTAMWLIPSCEPPIGALAIANPRETAFMRHVAACWPATQGLAHAGAWAPLTEISSLLIAGVVQAEDPRFFDHQGVDWDALGWALRDAVKTRR